MICRRSSTPVPLPITVVDTILEHDRFLFLDGKLMLSNVEVIKWDNTFYFEVIKWDNTFLLFLDRALLSASVVSELSSFPKAFLICFATFGSVNQVVSI